jgi:hypothetical protein
MPYRRCRHRLAATDPVNWTDARDQVIDIG